jgi:YD repeat-containing protein
MRRIAILFILTTISSVVFGQIEKRNMFPTPNAASLGLYGQIPVDFFTGLPQISIPLVEFKSRDLTVPISLSYHAAGIKPSDHASWVGLGWSLQAGGVITRIQNDLPDEFIDYDHVGSGVYLNREKRGFFYNYSYLGDANWLTTTFDKEARAFFQTGVADYSWALENLTYRRDICPDEFQFNFMGMSGSFFMGQDGQWKLKSKDGFDFTVTTEIGQCTFTEPTAQIGYHTFIKNNINKIILKGPNGTEYTFGGGTNYAANEFVRSGIGMQVNYGWRDGGTIAKSWYLTKIKSITGDEINFEYTRDGYQIMNNTGGIAYTYACPTCTPTSYYYTGPGIAITDNLQILSAVSLSSIISSNGRVDFQKDNASILDFTLMNFNPLTFPSSTFQIFESYGYEVFNGNITSVYAIPALHSAFKKLTQIDYKSNDGLLKSFTFNYLENTSNRLFLTSLVQKGSDGATIPPYTFAYVNPNALAGVPYETTKIDHWGYYTAIDPLSGLTFPPLSGTYGVNLNPTLITYGDASNYSAYLSIFDNTFETSYTYNRRAQSYPASMGILGQITYPTGGNTQFEWQPNKYSKQIDQTPVNNNLNITVSDAGFDTDGPGLRIYKIKTQADANSPQNIKTYNYYRDYINHTSYLSTGVLNSRIPKYVDFYSQVSNYVFKAWSTSSRIPLHYTNGSPLTYSKVQEINSDGGFKQYTYSNHDNGYLDQIPEKGVFTNYGDAAFQEFTTNSRELERGQLLEEVFYSQNFYLLKKIEYQYNDDPNRFNEAIRKYQYENKFTLNGTIINWQAIHEGTGGNPFSPGAAAFTGANFWAMKIYTFFPFLKSKTETNYHPDGTNPVTNTTAYTYDNYRNIHNETLTSSNGDQVINLFNHPGDNITGLTTEAQLAKSALLASHNTSTILEHSTSRNSTELMKGRNNYKIFENEAIFNAPSNREQSVEGNPIETEAQYVNFDSKGNMLQFIGKDNVINSFQWDYNQSYPTVKILNAGNTVKTVTTSQDITATNYMSVFVGPSNQSMSYGSSFTTTRTGNIVITIPTSIPPNANLSVTYSLTGPASASGTLCVTANPGISCNGSPSSVTLTNMPAGQYSLSGYASTNFTSFSFGGSITCSYPSIAYTTTTSGIKEFFYQSFEEVPGSAIANPYAGRKYYSGDYTVPYTMPNSKPYKVNYHYLDNGTWKNITKNYSNNMVLNEGTAIDEVRVFPADAYITTYTYDLMVGMTSETDVNGRTTYYKYDNFQRLTWVLDQDKNVIKKICYNYSGQPDDCNSPTFTNDLQQGTFTGVGPCSGGLVPPTINYSIAAGTYTSFESKDVANQMAIEALNTLGQAAANALPCEAPISALNTTTTPFNVNITNTAGTFNNTYSLYPNSSPAVIATVPSGTYTITITGMYAPPSSAVQLIINGNTYTGTSFTIPNVSITAPLSFTVQNVPGPSCSFSMASGYTNVTSSISASGSVVTFYLVFYRSSAAMTAGNTYQVATINGGCRPSSTRTINFSSQGRNWTITIFPSGQMNWYLQPGSPQVSAGSVVSSPSLSYNL